MATQPLADLAQKIELAEAAVVSLGVAFGVQAVSTFSDYQSAMIDLEKVLDSTDPKIQSFADTADQLSLKYGVASDTILKGIANFKQAGFTAAEAAELQKNALDLVIAGDIDAANASDLLVRSLKGFNLTAAEAPKFIEALNAVSNKYATDVKQLAEGMARLSPIAETMGFTFQESAGLLTPIIEVFGSGSEAADALKTGLLRLVDDSKPVRAALESIGVAQLDVNGKLRSGKDIFYDVATAFQSMDEKQKLFVTSQLVGIEQAPRMVKVFDDLAKVQEITKVAYENNGTAIAEVDKRLNSLEVVINRNVEAWRLLSKEVGQQLSTGAASSTQSMITLATALSTAVKAGQFAPIIDGINAAELGFAKFVEKIAKNLPEALSKVDFSGLVAAFQNLGGQFGDIFSGLDVGTPQGLANAIQFLVDSLESLTLMSAGVVNGLTPMGKAILALIDYFNKLPDSVKFSIGTISGFAQSINSSKDLIGGMAAGLVQLHDGFVKLVELKITGDIVRFLTSLSGMAPQIAVLAESLAGKAGLAGAAGVAGYAIGTQLADALDSFISGIAGHKTTLGSYIYDLTHTGDAYNKLSTEVDKSDQVFRRASQTTGLSIKSLYDLTKAVDDGIITYDSATDSWVKAGKAVRDFDAEVAAASKGGLSDFEITANKLAGALITIKDRSDETVQSFSTLAEAEKAAAEINSLTTNSYIRYSNGVYELHTSQKALAETSVDVAEKTKQIAEATDKLTERQKIGIQYTHELELKLLELASNERIKAMEFAVNFKIAEVQADAQKVVAAFEEIGQAVQATQEASASIFSDLSEALGNNKIRGLDKQFLQDYAKKQQEQAQQALDDQHLLIEAQVRNMNARTELMNRGDALIKINADDLQPELQLVMRSLLEHIQIESNLEGLEILLP